MVGEPLLPRILNGVKENEFCVLFFVNKNKHSNLINKHILVLIVFDTLDEFIALYQTH